MENKKNKLLKKATLALLATVGPHKEPPDDA
jgi:hypothetical protein